MAPAATGSVTKGRRLAVQLIDLSREIYHRTAAHPSHPPVVMGVRHDHDVVKTAGATKFTSKAHSLVISDDASTHVDAPCHFNPDPKAASRPATSSSSGSPPAISPII